MNSNNLNINQKFMSDNSVALGILCFRVFWFPILVSDSDVNDGDNFLGVSS